jgi:hypothetical protein
MAKPTALKNAKTAKGSPLGVLGAKRYVVLKTKRLPRLAV